MEKLVQELVEKIIDKVGRRGPAAYCNSLGGSLQRRVWGSRHCSFISQTDPQPCCGSLLLLLGGIHTLTLSSITMEGWKTYFDLVDVTFANLRCLIVANPPSNFGRYLPAVKWNFAMDLESLTLCMVHFVSILESFPHLRNLETPIRHKYLSVCIRKLPAKTQPVSGHRKDYPWLASRPTVLTYLTSSLFQDSGTTRYTSPTPPS